MLFWKFKNKINFMPSGVYKRTKEHSKNIGLSLKGRVSPMLGKKQKEESKLKMIKTKTDRNSFNKGGYKLSSQTRMKMSKRMMGSGSPNWRGGVTKLQKIIRWCFKSRQWRSDVFTRDDFTCQLCFKRGGDLHADHIKPFALILEENKIFTLQQSYNCEELWNINNGRTLCEICHKKTDTWGSKTKKLLLINY